MDHATVYGLSPDDVMMIYSGTAVLALFGLVGNILSLIVWTRPQMKSTSAIMLAALAVCDILIVWSAFPHAYFTALEKYELAYHGIKERSRMVSYTYRFILPHMEAWMYPVHSMALTASIYLTLALTVDRFIAVCYPFQYLDICSYGRACKSTFIIITFSILYNVVKFWDIQVLESRGDNGTVWSYYAMPTDLAFDPLMIIYRDWSCLFFLYLIPLAAIIVCNTTICCKLRMARRERRGLTDFQKKELRFAMLLVYVVLEFIVGYSVSGFLTIVNSFNIGLFFNPEPLIPTYDFFNVFNSSVNFVTYITFGKPFRKTFIKTFCCCVKSCRKSGPRNRKGTSGVKMDADGIHMMKTNYDNPCYSQEAKMID